MSKSKPRKVLVDTSYLINLYDSTKPKHRAAKKYFRYFLDKSIQMYLSTIVIAEFHQGQSIADLIRTGNYIVLPFNVGDATKSADAAHGLGGQNRIARAGETTAKHKDDIKIIGQAESQGMDFLITDDRATLSRYAKVLKTLGAFQPKIIELSEEFDSTYFGDHQTALLD